MTWLFYNTRFSFSFFSCFLFFLIALFSAFYAQTTNEVLLRLSLTPGWNLFSLPVQPENINPEAFFGDHTTGKLWQFSEGQYTTAEAIEAGVGYWIYAHQEADIVFKPNVSAQGNPPANSPSKGWNLVGSHSAISIPNQAKIGWVFENEQYQPIQNTLVPGQGYWLNLQSTPAELDLGSLENDTDTDDIPDYWEQLWGFKYNSSDDQMDDPDDDQLENLPEFEEGTNPRHADTDLDGLKDGEEISQYLTDPKLADTDGEGLLDGEEVKTYLSDPLKSDSDEDNYTDREEVDGGTDPNESNVFPVTTLSSSPAHGEAGVAITRETIIRFSRPLAKSTPVDGNCISAEFGGESLPATIHVSRDRQIVTLFYENTLPASARIRVSIKGDLLEDERGHFVDGDNNGSEGGTAIIDFDTLTLTTIPETAVCGRVFASEFVPGDGTELNMPLKGVKITVDGAEETMFAVTDVCGNFRLDPAPAGRFFVHINGHSVTEVTIDGETITLSFPGGPYYPEVGKAWESVPGEETNVGNIYLPLVDKGTLQEASNTEETEIVFPASISEDFPELAATKLIVPPGALISEDGSQGGRIGIAPVDPNRLPGAMPDGFQFPMVITVQTDGATNFDRPVPVVFPNLPDPITGEVLAPGESTGLWSFNHDTGEFELVGSMTVSEDGKTIMTDPGVGILAPGWHGRDPWVQNRPQKPPGNPSPNPPPNPPPGDLGGPPPGGPGAGGSFGGGGDGVGGINLPDPFRLQSSNGHPWANALLGSDHVDLATGEFYLTVVDLQIKGRGFDFLWSRKYRSREGVNSAHGRGWDHNYNIRIEDPNLEKGRSGRILILHDGDNRVEEYHLNANNRWVRNEFFRDIVKNDDQTYTLTFADNTKWHFHDINEFNEDVAGKIKSAVDRTGNNTMTFDYDDEGRLVKIVDTLGRTIEIGYHENELADYVATVTDFFGRTVSYDYELVPTPPGTDSFVLLKSVTNFVITDTPNNNNFANGKTVFYEYAEAPKKRSLLTSITDPRGNTYLTNTYGGLAAEPRFPTLDRVLRQERGGGIIDYVYFTEQLPTVKDPLMMKTIVNDQVGNVSEHFFGAKNRLIRKLDYTGTASPKAKTTNDKNRPGIKKRPTDPKFFETKYEYNGDSLPTKILHPNGNIVEVEYEGDQVPEIQMRSRGNRKVTRYHPGNHNPPGDQSRIVEVHEYDLTFNFVTNYTDGRGNEAVYEYDDVGNMIRRIHRISSIEEILEYNEHGQLTKITHPDNGKEHRRQDVFTYNESGAAMGYLKEKIIDDGGLELTTQYEYDDVGNVIKEIDPRGNDTQYILNQYNQTVRRLSRVVGNGIGRRYQRNFFYDGNNNLIQVDIQNVNDQGQVDSNTNFTKSYEYGILNFVTRIAEEVDPNHDIITEHVYDPKRRKILTRFGEATRQGGQSHNTLTTIYDERDLVFQEIRAQNHEDQSTTQYDYDRNRNLVRTLVGLEDTPRIHLSTYDGYNRLVESEDPMGNLTEREYDANSNLVRQTIKGELKDDSTTSGNTLLSEISYSYDDKDRLIEEDVRFFDTNTQADILDGHSITKTTWSDFSQILRVVNDNDHEIITEYDGANRPEEITDAKGNTVTQQYDKNSNIIKITEVDKSDLGNQETFVTTNEYDNLDRLTKTIDPIDNTMRYSYDSRKNQTLRIDALDNVVRYEFDGLNRLTQTTRELKPSGSIITRQEWDDSSRLIKQIDDNDNETTYTYDPLNRKVLETYADGTIQSFVYDAHDNRIESTDANGSNTKCTYDLLNRLVKKDIDVAESVSDATTFEVYQYDGLSRIVLAEDNDSVVERSYDSLSNITKEILNGQETVSVYDGVGNQVKCIYPNGREINCTFDELERKQTVSDENGLIADYDFIGKNRVARRDYGNDTRLVLGYDDDRRITRTTHSLNNEDSTKIDEHTYTWDKMDNKITRNNTLVEGAENRSFTYDSIYRMTESTGGPSGNITYDFDGVGNRTTVTNNQTPETYTLDKPNPPADFQMNQYTTTPQDTREYDQNGNLTKINNVGGASRRRLLTYDYRNQMVSHEDTETGVVTTYAYDTFGRRISKQITDNGSPSTDNYFYDKNRVCEEQDENRIVQATYVYGHYIDDVLNMQRNGMDYYYHCDDLYNVTAITDPSGTVVERYVYEDYGQPTTFNQSSTIIQQSSIQNPYLFTGRRFDPESEFYYYRTRYMEPFSGRFTTRDTIGIWGDELEIGNGYTYSANTPWSAVDPYGLKTNWVVVGVGVVSIAAGGWALYAGYGAIMGAAGLAGMLQGKALMGLGIGYIAWGGIEVGAGIGGAQQSIAVEISEKAARDLGPIAGPIVVSIFPSSIITPPWPYPTLWPKSEGPLPSIFPSSITTPPWPYPTIGPKPERPLPQRKDSSSRSGQPIDFNTQKYSFRGPSTWGGQEIDTNSYDNHGRSTFDGDPINPHDYESSGPDTYNGDPIDYSDPAYNENIGPSTWNGEPINWDDYE